MDNKSIIIMVLSVLFGLSEALASIPSVKANSIFQLISGIISTLLTDEKGSS